MRKLWGEENDKILREIYKLYTNKELAEIFGFSKSTIARKKESLDLKLEKKYPDGYKKCWMCQSILPFEDFYKNKSNGDGVSTHCKICDKIRKHSKTNKMLNAINEAENFKRDRINRYKEKHKDDIFFCKKCNCEKSLEDYYLYMDKNNNVHRQCKLCSKARFKEHDIKRAMEKGY